MEHNRREEELKLFKKNIEMRQIAEQKRLASDMPLLMPIISKYSSRD
jgi:hypothetical protein